MDNRTLFRTLAIAALVDGVIAPEEKELLKQHAAKLGISNDEIREILAGIRSGEDAGIAKPHSPEARLRLFRSVVQIVRADGKVTGKELALVRRLGNALNIDEGVMQAALEGKKV